MINFSDITGIVVPEGDVVTLIGPNDVELFSAIDLDLPEMHISMTRTASSKACLVHSFKNHEAFYNKHAENGYVVYAGIIYDTSSRIGSKPVEYGSVAAKIFSSFGVDDTTPYKDQGYSKVQYTFSCTSTTTYKARPFFAVCTVADDGTCTVNKSLCIYGDTMTFKPSYVKATDGTEWRTL